MVIKKAFWISFWIIFIIIFLVVAFFVSPFIYKAITGDYPESFPLSEETKLTETNSVNEEKGIEIADTENSPIEIKWEQLKSPPGGGYWSISIAPSDPNNVLIATRDLNVIKSSDGGKTWQLLGEKLFGAHIFSNIAINPRDENYFLVSNGFVHATEDGGVVWDTVSNEQIGSGETEGVTALFFDPLDGNKVFAGQDDEVFISNDKGKNWNLAGKIEGNTIRDIAITPDYLYVLASNNGIYKSADNGNNWEKINSGLGETFQYRDLFYDSGDNKLYLATDNGLHILKESQWNKINYFDDTNSPIKIVAVGDIIYVSSQDKKIYKSQDSGNSWGVVYEAKDISSHQGFNFAISLHSSNPDIVFAATDNEILKTTNGGNSWESIGKEIYDDSIFTINYAKDTNNLWIGEYWTRGLFTTTNEGETWRFIESWRSAEPHDHYPMNIIIDYTNGKNVYVSGAFGVKQTKNNGDAWSAIGSDIGINENHVHGLQIDSENPDVLFAGSAPGWGQESQSSMVFKSIDKGVTWKKLSNFPQEPENNVYAFSVLGNVIYASLNQHESEHNEEHENALGIWKSLDGGTTWKDVSSNLPNKNVFSVTANPENPDVVYVGLGHIEQFSNRGEQGLFRSINGGESWERVDGLPEIQPSKIKFHPTNSDIVLVSFGEHICGACGDGVDEKDEYKYPNGGGLWGSVDGGDTWYQLTTDKFSDRQMAVMDFVFKNENIVYAATDDGIFKGVISFMDNGP